MPFRTLLSKNKCHFKKEKKKKKKSRQTYWPAFPKSGSYLVSGVCGRRPSHSFYYCFLPSGQTWHISVFYTLYYKHILNLTFVYEPYTCKIQSIELHIIREIYHPWDGLFVPLTPLLTTPPITMALCRESPRACCYKHTQQSAASK